MAKTDASRSWNFHKDRDFLIAEAHARPSQNITPPAEILHMAFRSDDTTYQKIYGTIRQNVVEGGTSRHITGQHEDIRIKLERHNEFTSCTLFKDATSRKKKIVLRELVEELFPIDRIEVLVLLQLEVYATARQMMKALPDQHRVSGGSIRGEIDIRSTFQPDEHGIIRFVLNARNQTSDELGRRLQRLIEMETYRTMSLLGLPIARSVGNRLTEYEKELDDLNVALRESINNTDTVDERLFERFSSLSEKNNLLAGEFRYRFAASRAYYTLFQQRVDSLEETPVGDLQTMSGFLRSRVEPAMATIESTAKRQEALTNDLSRALVLLRTRIELNLNKGNQELLQSMDRRHHQQLKISRTVEGLSVVAITYYAVGLASYLLEALAKQPWVPFSDTIMTAVSVPFILLGVWYSLHRIRQAWEDRSAR